MRKEIGKYRAKCLIDNNRHKKGDWVYGYLVKGENTYIITEEQFYSAVVSMDGHMATFCCVVDPKTVGEFTGVRNIYEGDKFDINGKIMFVEFVEDHGRYVLTTGNGYDTRNCIIFDCDIVYGKEIIGNIHEEII